MRCLLFFAAAVVAVAAFRAPMHAQNLPLTPSGADKPKLYSPLVQPTLEPGQIELLELEGRFQKDVANGGGKAFASWFADDAVTLNNGKAAVLGHNAIAAAAQWDPANYQLTWVAEGAKLGPSGDMGYTWGHYEADFKDKNGQPASNSGRYITFWVKKDGRWKVSLDASADDVPAAGDCCALPKP